ncbi:MAG: phosphoribosyltransferase family protein [candidate division WOR-3 bacterium]
MDYKKLLESSKALLEGHFLLTSGLHSDKYIEKMRILESPALMRPFFEKMEDLSPKADWFVGPTLGGAIIAFELARITGVKSAFAERTEKGRTLKREFAIKKSDKIVIVDDILTTGSSIKETINAINKGEIVTVVVMIDRSVSDIELGIPVKSVLKYPIEIFRPEICPLCKEKIPITIRGGKR